MGFFFLPSSVSIFLQILSNFDEGLSPETIIKTGSPMKEVLNYYEDKIQLSNVLVREKLKKHNYFIISMHREENLDSDVNLSELLNSLNSNRFYLPS